MELQNYMYFPVDNITIHDLYDWSLRKKDSNAFVVCGGGARRPGSVVVRSPRRNVSLRKGQLVKVNEQEVALFRYGNVVYAISEHCPHAGGPLHIGDIENLPRYLCVKCPYHGWKFDLVTGKCIHPKGWQDKSAAVYPVRVCPTSGSLTIGFTEFSSKYFSTLIE